MILPLYNLNLLVQFKYLRGLARKSLIKTDENMLFF